MPIFNRLGADGALLQTASLFLSHSFTDPFPPDLQNIITPKPLELES